MWKKDLQQSEKKWSKKCSISFILDNPGFYLKSEPGVFCKNKSVGRPFGLKKRRPRSVITRPTKNLPRKATNLAEHPLGEIKATRRGQAQSEAILFKKVTERAYQCPIRGKPVRKGYRVR